MTIGHIRIGIGGWIYEPWRETFYPPGLPKVKELAHASRHVTTIEINATFYRTQTAQTFRKWADETPDDFVFAVKAVRYAVNRRDLGEAGESIQRFVDSGLTELGPKLGPILWQFAGTKKFDPHEIETFLASLPANHDGIRLRHVVEARHPTFVSKPFVELARRYGVAICLAQSNDYPLIADPTASFCYLRLQTTTSTEMRGYDDATLTTWTTRLRDLAAGKPARGLPLLADPPEVRSRDCFAYVISGAKERNPAAAQGLIERLARD